MSLVPVGSRGSSESGHVRLESTHGAIREDQKHRGGSPRTIAAIETDESGRIDARRRVVPDHVRTTLEVDCDIEFTFANSATGEGVRMRKAISKTDLDQRLKGLADEAANKKNSRKGR
jgi:hypothetical protein